MIDNTNTAIQRRISSNKSKVLEQLEQTPIVQVACSKSSIGRATYYRWRKEDARFLKSADEAIAKGRLFINDLAESKLLASIQDQNMTGIIFWLKHNHPTYATRVEITQKEDEEKDQLNPEEESKVKKALRMAGILIDKEKEVSDEKPTTQS